MPPAVFSWTNVSGDAFRHRSFSMSFEDFMKSLFRRHDADKLSEKNIAEYLKNGRKPWSKGYMEYRQKFIRQVLGDLSLMERFKRGRQLPECYGEFLDERVVEYPWFLSRAGHGGKLLDAGSALNFDFVLATDGVRGREVTIVTLVPEDNSFWKDRVSYLYCDMRNLPLRDEWFDEVVSISTIEHVGMDNTMYASNGKFNEKQKKDYLVAVSELKRVTKPGGKVYITVPYGKYTDFGWYQQFSGDMIDEMTNAFSPARYNETYFHYEAGGWRISDRKYCQNFEGFNIHDTKYLNPRSSRDYDPDYAAASRAIAALELWK